MPILYQGVQLCLESIGNSVPVAVFYQHTGFFPLFSYNVAFNHLKCFCDDIFGTINDDAIFKTKFFNDVGSFVAITGLPIAIFIYLNRHDVHHNLIFISGQ